MKETAEGRAREGRSRGGAADAGGDGSAGRCARDKGQDERAPELVVALGNPLAGDDGVAGRVLGALERHPHLPSGVELLDAGIDLFRCAARLAGRRRIWLLDAVLEEGPAASRQLLESDAEESGPGSVPLGHDPVPAGVRPGRTALRLNLAELADEAPQAHHLSPVAAIAVLARVDPAFGRPEIRLIGLPIGEARVGKGLSPALERRLPALVEEVLELLGAVGPTGAA